MNDTHWSDSPLLRIAFFLAALLAFSLIPDDFSDASTKENSPCQVLKGMEGIEGTAEWDEVAAQCKAERRP